MENWGRDNSFTPPSAFGPRPLNFWFYDLPTKQPEFFLLAQILYNFRGPLSWWESHHLPFSTILKYYLNTVILFKAISLRRVMVPSPQKNLLRTYAPFKEQTFWFSSYRDLFVQIQLLFKRLEKEIRLITKHVTQLFNLKLYFFKLYHIMTHKQQI